MPRDGDQRVRAYVERQPEALPAGVHEPASQVVAVGEGDAVHDHVDAAEPVAERLESGCDVVVGAHVTLDQGDVTQRVGQLRDAAPQPLVLVGEGQRCAGLVQHAGDGPGDATLVGDSDYDYVLAGEVDCVHQSISAWSRSTGVAL